MTISELIKSCNIDEIDGRIRCANTKFNRDHLDEIVDKKPEIIAHIQAQKAEAARIAAEHSAKIDAIEGLRELRDAIGAEEEYYNKLNAAIHRGGINTPTSPRVNAEDLRAVYPRAAAYVLADSWLGASNDQKAAAGRRATERIINGEPHETVVADMEREWSEAAAKSVWND